MAHSNVFCLSGEQALPLEFYKNGAAHFEIQDWEGTERVQTSYNGAVEGTYRSLPYGDGYSASGTDDDAYHFAMLDQDNSSDDHAIFREYSNMTGRWMSPDPYYGSYNLTDPQSFNRYAYVMNNPSSFVDPLGLIERIYPPPPAPPPGPCAIFNCSPPSPAPPSSGGGGGAGKSAPSNGTSTCTILNGRTTGIAPGQAPGVGAFGFVPQAGSVAIDPWSLGLPPGGSTNALLGPNASQITFSFSPAPNLPQGYPTTITLGSIVGPKSVRAGGANFDGFFDFDFYGLPSLAAAYAVTSQPVAVTVTYPSSLPISCNGPSVDSPLTGPIPPPPGPVPALRGALEW